MNIAACRCSKIITASCDLLACIIIIVDCCVQCVQKILSCVYYYGVIIIRYARGRRPWLINNEVLFVTENENCDIINFLSRR